MGLLSRIQDKLTQAEKREGQAVLSRFKGVTEFLSDAVDATKDNDVLKGIAQAVPWQSAQIVGEAAVQALPPLKFASTILSKVFEITDRDELAYLACTIAYQQSVEQAVCSLGRPATSKKATKALGKAIGQKTKDEAYDFAGFSFETASDHPFRRDADAALEVFAQGLGYNQDERRTLLVEVHERFVPNLKDVLATSEDRFRPFLNLIQLDSAEARLRQGLNRHADYQAWRFDQRPVFGREPFALDDIYVEVECGRLRWEQIDESRSPDRGPGRAALNPFVERNGGRQELLPTVLEILGDPSFRDAIVVQGVAGSGKSTFALRLCKELRERGLRPILVRLSDLKLEANLRDTLPQAIKLRDPHRGDDGPTDLEAQGEDLFRGKALFNDPVPFGNAKISPYVLIFDAWDELSVGVSGNLHDRIEKVLGQIRAEFLDRSDGLAPIRVVVTGRPSTSVERSGFLRKTTPILTIRPLKPDSLRGLVDRLIGALVRPSELIPEGWPRPKPGTFDRVYGEYERDFKRLTEAKGESSETGALEVMGHPLLAQVVVRLVVHGKVDPATLIDDPTTLYRTLVDVTCEHAGQVDGNAPGNEDSRRLQGRELRRLLRQTAAAISVTGGDSISHEELALRIEQLERHPDPERHGSFLDRIKTLTDENRMAELLVGYYFKTGHAEAGCEFAHKSFREYLFAEAIVEELKAHAAFTRETSRVGRDDPEEKLHGGRGDFWKDFAESDPRHHLSRTLGQLLAPVWLSREVESHVRHLIAWEVRREPGAGSDRVAGLKALPTEPIAVEDWELVRDDLAALWAWWGEGVHLRPQLYRKGAQIEGHQEVYALDLIRWAMPQVRPSRPAVPPPPRTVTVDAHLGAGLLLLCVATHREIAIRRGYLDGIREREGLDQGTLEEDPRENVKRRMPYQVEDARTGAVLFDPSSTKGYLRIYLARLNAAGWRLPGPFASWTDFSLLWLADANLFQADLRFADLRGANLFEADLRGANLSASTLFEADLSNAELFCATLFQADLRFATLFQANFSNAKLRNADLSGADLSGADLSGADLSNADLSNADLSNAKLSGADLSGAKGLTHDQLRSARTDEWTILPADLLPPTASSSSQPDPGNADFTPPDAPGEDPTE